MCNKLFGVRIFPWLKHRDVRAFGQRHRIEDGFHKFFSLRNHGNAVQCQRAIQRLDCLGAGQRGVIDDRNRGLQTGRTQDSAAGQIGILFKNLVDRRVKELEENVPGPV